MQVPNYTILLQINIAVFMPTSISRLASIVILPLQADYDLCSGFLLILITPQSLKMGLKFIKWGFALLLTLICKLNAQITWTSISSDTLNIPSHTFKIYVPQGYKLAVYLTWTTSNSDIDVYIYTQGRNLQDYYQYYSTSSSTTNQNFVLTSGQSIYYYFKMFPYYLSQQILQYNFTYVMLNTSATASFYRGFIRDNKKNVLIFVDNPWTVKIPYRYTLSSGYAVTVQLFSSTNYKLYNLTQGEMICPDVQIANSKWILMFSHSTPSPIYQLIPYFYQFQKGDQSYCLDCQPGYIRNNITLNCEQIAANTTTNTATPAVNGGLIAGVISGVAVLIVAIIIAILVYRRYKERNGNKAPTVPPEPISIDNIYCKQTCSICLGNDCNSVLPCKHSFHRICITQWLKKNNMCPICRHQFAVQKIVNFA